MNVKKILLCAVFSFCVTSGYILGDSIKYNYITAAETKDADWNDEINGSYKVVNCTNLNMRAEPNLDAEIMAAIPKDTVVNVIATNGEWTKYEFDGKTGYSLSKYVVKLSWKGDCDVSWYDSQESEFHIFTAEELAGVAYLVNESGKDFENQIIFLESDIDLSGSNWSAIANTSKTKFAGTFDGQNHTIKNMICTVVTGYSGLFGKVTGQISNLIVTDCNIGETPIGYVKDIFIDSDGRSGGIAAIIDKATIENCHVVGSITGGPNSSNGWGYAGGIVGEVNGSSVVKKCSSKANVTCSAGGRNGYAGGICGRVNGESVVDECFSESITKVTCSRSYEPYAGYAGGICGALSGISKIENSYNAGEIFADSKHTDLADKVYYNNNSTAGGVVAYLSEESTIENVYNIGKVTAERSGGVVAILDADSSYNNVYYLTGSATKGVFKGEDNTIAKNSTNMKKEEFAISLGEKFCAVSDNYVKLKWELEQSDIEDSPEISISSMKVGETIQIEVTNYSGSITWISSDTKLLTVDSEGNAKALAPGKVKLVAILENGKALTGDILIGGDKPINGDLNSDGVLNASDLLIVQKWFCGSEELTASQKKAIDFNDDGKINIVDICLIKNKLLSI